MGYYKRRQSEGEVYHVFARGTGKRIIFEDDADRLEYVQRIESLKPDYPGELYAWCLMGNHVHLLFCMRLENVAVFMKRLNGAYARLFNERHGRVGHLFEGRYGSEPITSDEHLLTAVRYIHRNPVKAGISGDCDYPWSSYREYLGAPFVVDTERVLDMVGGVPAFASLHEQDESGVFLDVRDEMVEASCRMTQDEALVHAKRLLGKETFEALPGLERETRNGHLRRLKASGMSVRQIELVTGVSRGVVQRAVKGMLSDLR